MRYQDNFDKLIARRDRENDILRKALEDILTMQSCLLANAREIARKALEEARCVTA